MDRNLIAKDLFVHRLTSPSSRRAWIEITLTAARPRIKPSPSSRRAWIEIAELYRIALLWLVALLAEGVDRNSFRS